MSPARRIRGTPGGRARAICLLVAVAGSFSLLSCRDDAVSPTLATRAELDQIPDDELDSFLVQDGGEPVGSPLIEQIITVPADEGTEAPVDVTLWEAGEVSGPVVIEVTSTLALESGDVLPIQDAINYGTVVWFEPVGILFAAPAAAVGPEEDTVIVVSRQIGLTLHSIEAASNWVIDTTLVTGQTATVRLVDPTASEHGFGIWWEYSGAEVSHGFEPDLDDPACVDFWYRCAAVPGQEGRRAHGPLAGTIEVRVYQAAEQANVDVSVEVDHSALHPAITAVSPVNSRDQAHRDGDATTVAISVTEGGVPVSGAPVSVRAALVENSGGHTHFSEPHYLDGLPRVPADGRYDPSLHGTSVAGHFILGTTRSDGAELVTNALGVATVDFVSGFLGGAVDIVVTVQVGATALVATARVDMRVPGLVPLKEEISNAHFVGGTGGATGTGHPQGTNWYVRPETVSSMQEIATALQLSLNGSSAFLQFNDASLPWGGSFTSSVAALLPVEGSTATVDNPLADHRSHALGIDVDVAFCYALAAGVDPGQEHRVSWDNDHDQCIAAGGTPSPDLQLDRELAEQIMDAYGDAEMHAAVPGDPDSVNHFHIRFQELL